MVELCIQGRIPVINTERIQNTKCEILCKQYLWILWDFILLKFRFFEFLNREWYNVQILKGVS